MNIHEETLKIARNLMEKDPSLTDWVISKFPELREESEDERIRKECISIIDAWDKSCRLQGDYCESASTCIAWLEKQGEKELVTCPICGWEIEKQDEQKPITDFSDLRTWKYIVDAAWTEKDSIGQYLDSPFIEEVAKKLQKRFGNIEQKPEMIFLKFRIGDKVTNGENAYTIDSINKDCYWVKEHDCITIPFECQHYWRLIEQKPAWSEEDENAIQVLKDIVKHSNEIDENIYTTPLKEKLYDWLKFLKDRVQPQPKQEWSEEDEEIIECLNNCLDELEEENGWRYVYVNNKNVELNKIRNWLKSLSPQNRWEPSDEQMDALDDVIDEYDGYPEFDSLVSLKNDLKKLREK